MAQWEKILILPDISIFSALKILDQSAMQLLLVVDPMKRLLGTISDGDFRRGILKGISMDACVRDVMNSSPIVGSINDNHERIFALMRTKKLRHIPILNKNGCVVRVETLDEYINVEEMENPVVLMAGGLGTRLRPLTDDCPKPLLNIGGRPLLETIISNLEKNGFRNIFISVNYRAEMIEKYFGDGSQFGVNIRYIHEEQRMGTAGALTLLPEAPTKPIIIMNGDLLTKVNFKQLLEFHIEREAKATMCVRDYEFQVPYGVININEHRIKSIVEKPIQRYYVNAGIYVLNPEVLKRIPKETFYDMPTLYEQLVHSNEESVVFPIREYWLDIGRMDDYNRANVEFMEVFG
ncbi:nucleotidyltransferase family protein [Paenibacillus sp. GCM10027628]|uniref:nucleotidyltransferase family protein n=1 Tax=Paenibacillus sp. GCM10027628 TaxID=3273413 RepID=UPI00363A0ABF